MVRALTPRLSPLSTLPSPRSASRSKRAAFASQSASSRRLGVDFTVHSRSHLTPTSASRLNAVETWFGSWSGVCCGAASSPVSPTCGRPSAPSSTATTPTLPNPSDGSSPPRPCSARSFPRTKHYAKKFRARDTEREYQKQEPDYSEVGADVETWSDEDGRFMLWLLEENTPITLQIERPGCGPYTASGMLFTAKLDTPIHVPPCPRGEEDVRSRSRGRRPRPRQGRRGRLRTRCPGRRRPVRCRARR